ncbi:hypothetical protein MKX01_000887 [Papaver californicum]|nr:hypothetical protein MKX01_000887 [Papaver californicum]
MENENQSLVEEDWGIKSWKNLERVREKSPLIQCITNYVSMDLMANTLLASGASPAMLHCLQEIPDFTPHADALCLNVGTLSPDWLPSMKSAAKCVSELGKPWVFDPVAVSASEFRLRTCLELVSLKPAVIRGNASEILALANASRDTHSSKGADSSHGSMDAIEAATSLAKACGAVVAVSGAVDIITDGQTGCAVTALIAAFVAVDPLHAFEATASALSIFGVAGEIGMDLAKGPASLRMHLIDSLHGLYRATVLSRVNISCMS